MQNAHYADSPFEKGVGFSFSILHCHFSFDSVESPTGLIFTFSIMSYLSWDQKTITDFSSDNIANMYDRGYVFTRLGRGIMVQTRSVRINLAEFTLTSENRRILKKTDELKSRAVALPLKEYDYKLGKLAKDFYETKFGAGIMSAQKVKEMLTDAINSNFNMLLVYFKAKVQRWLEKNQANQESSKVQPPPFGYAICYSNKSLLYYSYPFYSLEKAPKDMGIGMMIRAIEYAKESGLEYAYLGSIQNSAGLYKLQFKGSEWFDGTKWRNDAVEVEGVGY